MSIINYDTLVLSGASTKAFIMLGALQKLYDDGKHKEITTFIGTSAGAMINYLLIIGYTPIEIFLYICTQQLLDKIPQFNLFAILQGKSASSFISIQEILERMTIDKIGYLPTISDIKQNFKKNFICVTYNLTENCTEYISEQTHPKIPCITALRMTSNLPFIFEQFKYGHSFYIDGGISEHFPILLGEQSGNKVLGLVIFTTKYKEIKTDAETDMLEYLYKLICIPCDQSSRYKIKQTNPEKCTIIEVEPSDHKMFHFHLKSKEQMELFSMGYQQLKNTTY